jgi:hypothetical protein
MVTAILILLLTEKEAGLEVSLSHSLAPFEQQVMTDKGCLASRLTGM